MKKIFLAGLCLSLSSWACAGAKENLIGKRLVMDIPEVQCAGLSFSKNGKDAAMYAELGQCQDPLHLRVRSAYIAASLPFLEKDKPAHWTSGMSITRRFPIRLSLAPAQAKVERLRHKPAKNIFFMALLFIYSVEAV